MKTIISGFAILFGIIFILNTSSCKKDDDSGNGNGNDSYPFSIEFKDGYFRDYGYVVLHSLDGSQVIDYKKIVGDGIADFGEVNENKVTVTTVRVEDNGDNIVVVTDLASPTGHWIFRGSPYYNQTNTLAEVTMSYPNESYKKLLMATSLGYNLRYSSNVPENQYTKSFSLTDFKSSDKLSIYGAVFSEQGGCYNWLPDQIFEPDIINYYAFEANKPLDKKLITSNKPLFNLEFRGFTKPRSRQNLIRLFKYWNTFKQSTNINVYFPSGLALSDLLMLCNGETTESGVSYTKFLDINSGIPDQIEIPDYTITAKYQNATDEIVNIQFAGDPDQVGARWYYSNNDPDYLRVYWYMYAEKDVSTLKRPDLPQEIMNDIGDKISLLKVSNVLMADYDLTTSHADIIKRFFIEDVPLYERYDEGFSYYYYLSDDKSCYLLPDYNDMYFFSNN